MDAYFAMASARTCLASMAFLQLGALATKPEGLGGRGNVA